MSDFTRACSADSSPRRSRSRIERFAGAPSTLLPTQPCGSATACNSSCSSRSRCWASVALGRPARQPALPDARSPLSRCCFSAAADSSCDFSFVKCVGDFRDHALRCAALSASAPRRRSSSVATFGRSLRCCQLRCFVAPLAQRLQAALLRTASPLPALSASASCCDTRAQLRGDELFALAAFFVPTRRSSLS